MALIKNWNNNQYSIPEAGDDGWPSLTDFLADLADNAQTTNGQKYAARTSTDETTTLSQNDYYIGINCSKPSSVVLPAVDEGSTFIIADESGNASNLPIKITATGATIESATEYILSGDNQKIGLLYNRGDWRVISNFYAVAFSKNSKDELTNKTIDATKNNIKINGSDFGEFVTKEFKTINEKISKTVSEKLIDAGENNAGIITASSQIFGGVKSFASGISIICPVLTIRDTVTPVHINTINKDAREIIVDTLNMTAAGGVIVPAAASLRNGESIILRPINTTAITRVFFGEAREFPDAILFGKGSIVLTNVNGNYIVSCNGIYEYRPNVAIESILTAGKYVFHISMLAVSQCCNAITVSGCVYSILTHDIATTAPATLRLNVPWLQDMELYANPAAGMNLVTSWDFTKTWLPNATLEYSVHSFGEISQRLMFVTKTPPQLTSMYLSDVGLLITSSSIPMQSTIISELSQKKGFINKFYINLSYNLSIKKNK
ncbi:hypothetical protein [Fluviispira vulneris]|uniref:hypothetical protein n=1 Tax=Fluviispira vulneris TaxID=2763012 RepID=UPI0016458609|nr:hypothetical protein [Fluviispira vulneris]